jgi:glutamyl-Q tRNA(Asp) synthetase
MGCQPASILAPVGQCRFRNVRIASLPGNCTYSGWMWRRQRRESVLSLMELESGPRGESGKITADPAILGDIVLARRDGGAAYHLAVVVDDAFQQVSLVTRGNDLYAATHVQRLLQALLGLPEPQYAHHRLILDAQGNKLSKRDGPVTLRDLRERGMSAADVRRELEF